MASAAHPSAAAPASGGAKQFMFADMAHEFATTRRVLARVPEGQGSWKPHPKSMSLGALAAHLANVPALGTWALRTDEMDMAQPLPPQPAPERADELVALFDEGAAELTRLLAETDEAALAATWTARRGSHVVFALPRAAVLRNVVLNHMIHHRAQLGMYLRLLDLPVPSMYGPTADER